MWMFVNKWIGRIREFSLFTSLNTQVFLDPHRGPYDMNIKSVGNKAPSPFMLFDLFKPAIEQEDIAGTNSLIAEV